MLRQVRVDRIDLLVAGPQFGELCNVVTLHAGGEKIPDDGSDSGFGVANKLGLEAPIPASRSRCRRGAIRAKARAPCPAVGAHHEFVSDFAGDALPTNQYIFTEDLGQAPARELQIFEVFSRCSLKDLGRARPLSA